MLDIFHELIKLSQADSVVFFSSVTGQTLYQHGFADNSLGSSQILRLLQRVAKLKQVESCTDITQDALFKWMGISGAFACHPLISEDDTVLGSIYFGSSQKILSRQGIDKGIKLLTDSYYESLRHQTIEEVESQTKIVSQRLKRYLSMGMSCGSKKIVGIDPIMEEQVFSCIEMYKSEKCSPVLILGESGTGKELVASALHYRSERKDATYVRFNCAEIASADPQMQRVELFGCKAGIASGVTLRTGLFVLANHGTLFLDEIGLLSMEAQGHLLRVLEDNKVRPVGEKDPVDVDIRLICANNQALQNLVKDSKFREDLFYRICSFVINIPPLRQRGITDHNLLIDYFIEEENRVTSANKKISSEARRKLHQHLWPGNVRELRATLRRAFYKIAKQEGVITEREIEFITHEPSNACNGESTAMTLFPNPWQKLSEVEKEMFRQASTWASCNPRERTQGHVAEMLGIHPNTMTKKLREYGINWPKA